MTLLPCRTWRCTTSSPSATPWSSSGESTGWRGRTPRHAWMFSSTSCIYLRRTVWSEISGWTAVLTLLRDGRVTSVSPYDRGFTTLGRPLTLMHGINVHWRLLGRVTTLPWNVAKEGLTKVGATQLSLVAEFVASGSKIVLKSVTFWNEGLSPSVPVQTHPFWQCRFATFCVYTHEEHGNTCSLSAWVFYNPAETIFSARPCLFDQLCVYCLQLILQSFSFSERLSGHKWVYTFMLLMQLLKEELTFSSSVPKMFLESEIIFLSTSVQLVSSETD